MRLFYAVIGVMLALLVGVLFAPLLVEDPGYILIRFQGWAVETSVVVLVVGLILIWVLLRLGTWLLALPRRGITEVKQRRERRHVEHSLAAISEGRWDRAEKSLIKSARTSEHPALNYLAAARAATDTDNQAQYLELAEAEGSDPFAVTLTRAELALAKGRLEEAAGLLKHLRDEYTRHSRVLRLSARCADESQNWSQLLALVPELRRARAVSEKRVDDWELRAALGVVAEAPDDGALETCWRQIGRRLRQEQPLVLAYCERAEALGREDLAMAALELAIKREWSDVLVSRYGMLQVTDPVPQLRQAERWLGTRGESAALLLTLGRLARRAGLWGKSAEYLRASLSREDSAQAWEALGQLYEREQCYEAARLSFSNALALNRGEDSVPVPIPQSMMQSGQAGDA